MRLIDAEAFAKLFEPGGKLYSELLEAEDMREILNSEELTPAVEAAPVVHAHWEMVEEKRLNREGELERTGSLIPMCTNCRHADWRFDIHFMRCPVCGAIMNEERKNETD